MSRLWAKTSRHLDMKRAEKIDVDGMHAFKQAISATSFVLSVIIMGGTHAFGQQLLDFERLKGNWTGSGWIYFSDGHRENASCRMNVRPQGRPDKGDLDVACTAGAFGLDGRAFRHRAPRRQRDRLVGGSRLGRERHSHGARHIVQYERGVPVPGTGQLFRAAVFLGSRRVQGLGDRYA